MSKIILISIFIVMGLSTIAERYPDAIRCGDGDNYGSIFVIANFQAEGVGLIYYFQAYASQDRYAAFNSDGSYKSSGGHYASRQGCQKKSLSTLDKQNRTIYYAIDQSKGKNQEEDNSMKNLIVKLEKRIAKMEEENTAIKNKMAKMKQQQIAKDKKIEKLSDKILEVREKLLSYAGNFWDYEQIKQTWLRDFEEKIVGNIKSKGLQIGSRWKLQQEGAAFVVRDIEGSKVKDSRIAFAQDTFSNPK